MKRLNSFDTNKSDNSYTFTECKGHYIDGMFDLHASAGTNIFGYANPIITQKISQAALTSNTGFWRLNNNVWDELGNKLDEITDNKYSSYIGALSGSDSVDNAIKLAWMYHGKDKKYILVRKKSFHSGSITGWQMNHHFDKSIFPQIEFVEFFDDLETTIHQLGCDNIAAVLVDTVPWVNGLHNDTNEYWQALQHTVDKYQLLLIVDEILTGLGRMGHWLHSHSLGLKPNMITLGKALTSGHENLSVTLIDSKVNNVIKDEWLPLGNSRSTNTLGAVAACATIDLIKEQQSLNRINEKIIPYVRQLRTILSQKGHRATAIGTLLYSKDLDKTIRNHLQYNNMFHSWDYLWHLPFYDITDDEMENVIKTFKVL